MSCSGFRSSLKAGSYRNYSIISSFIPGYKPLDLKKVNVLQYFLNDISKLLVITGAGVSTESGIPDYRSEKVGRFATSKSRPIEYQDFMKNKEVRQRYWARNFAGWQRFCSFSPNVTHMVLANWELNERLHWLITQNVDNLHQKAGSKRITELHGSTYRVKCMQCKTITDRQTLQREIAKLNPSWDVTTVAIAPDGDVDLPKEQVASFISPVCTKCGGELKPDIVFFGDNVPLDTVEFCYDKTDTADGLLILGSSLQVYSSYRFVKRFSDRKKPILIVNIGPTRGDELATMKVSAKCGEVLPLLNVSKEQLALPK